MSGLPRGQHTPGGQDDVAKRTKTTVYRTLDGDDVEVAYDPDAPCWMCGEPVLEASMSGTVVCPWCDCGETRDGRRWNLEDTQRAHANFAARRAEAEAAHAAELERQADWRLGRPPRRERASDLAERSLR